MTPCLQATGRREDPDSTTASTVWSSTPRARRPTPSATRSATSTYCTDRATSWFRSRAEPLEISLFSSRYDPATGQPYPPLPSVDVTGYRTFRRIKFTGGSEGYTQAGLGRPREAAVPGLPDGQPSRGGRGAHLVIPYGRGCARLLSSDTSIRRCPRLRRPGRAGGVRDRGLPAPEEAEVRACRPRSPSSRRTSGPPSSAPGSGPRGSPRPGCSWSPG